MKFVPILAAASAFALAACGSGDTVDEAETDLVDSEAMSAEVEPVQWAYDGEGGPENWGSISADNAVCDTGTRQSPFDIPATAEVSQEGAPVLAIDWPEGPLVVDGEGYNANFNAPEGGSITIDGETYDFIQMHMHTPSEYLLAGEQYAADAHFVHANDAGELAVVGVFFEKGEANPDVDTLWSGITTEDETVTPEGATFDPEALLPEERDYVHFMGSLTTPPCSENVRWFVMTNPVTISAEQAQMHTDAFGNTARPVQPMNDRDIMFADM
ncbi:MAG: carbonic anhydrase family protein [Pacificimonas sp.]|jgi:carbonic anhydrase|nr:carbonic anhydrase family protein [Pacificimonas sp.]